MLASCGRSGAPVADQAAAACPPGVFAQTAMTGIAFSDGWTRLVLTACPGAGPARRLEVEGADSVLAYTAGRPGGVTAAVLTASRSPASGGAQLFDAPPGSARAREVVLAPWPFSSAPPRLRRIRLLSADRP